VIEHRLIVRCDVAGCPAILLGGPLKHHGSLADSVELELAAVAMGWERVPARAVEDHTEGPWHRCPEHRSPHP